MEKNYLELLKKILESGVKTNDRTGVGTLSIFGANLRINLKDGFPILTTKKVPFKSVLSELLWFIEGSTDERRLAEIHFAKPREELIGKKTIWTANADEQGVKLGYENTDVVKQLGPCYGKQWSVQLPEIIENIKKDPYSRRHLVNSWNVSELKMMALPPCHYSYQFYVRNNTLNCMWNQRSVDAFLGLPFNISSYALLTHMVAQVCDLDVGELYFNGCDVHIYNNHIEQCKEQISRTPYSLPNIKINKNITNIHDFKMNDFELIGYQSHSVLKGDMAV